MATAIDIVRRETAFKLNRRRYDLFSRACARETGLSGWPLVFLTGASVAYVSYAAHRQLKSDIAVNWKAGGL